MNTTSTPDAIQAVYEDARATCDREAVRFKRTYQRAWAVSTVATWLTLILSIVALARPEWTGFRDFFLYGLVTFFSVVVMAATVRQIGLRSSWRNHRRGAEQLRSHVMLYRMKLAPYDDDAKRDEQFRKDVQDIFNSAHSGDGERFVSGGGLRRLLGLIRLPENLRQEIPHTPDQPDATGPSDDLEHQRDAVLKGRLANQQRWHLLKARKYLICWLVFQAAVIGLSLIQLLVAWKFEPLLWLVSIATAVTLMLYAVRDFLDLGPLTLRYTRVASNLEKAREEYLKANPSDQQLDSNEVSRRLRELTTRVEEILRQEYLYWTARK